ncbi:hypothetical protein C5C45_14625 [Rathayibacter rathayi]|uniref:four-carbon acid sugar kinase family protein n=1 Tax=Rathayibacter rathayi TaxID=33887 RepID=UPI000BC7D55C|nr:four-carbon acid sugar kinase family protein [Rathayibacter rathayi]AZZ47797.1 hypothetical protein C1O28_00125 [Rathayibacter rathayi]MWV75048.1 hypothetical protein [Rathayibacter rathayi NCPPB 2980 = VKM Ac-1601]PPF44313.1 hypothetical protein C5C08_13365 [Rathayibacter rathayi]PPG65276.1 hypothetical protein C5C16_13490 [Rathayibacter rathayi]PPG74636.1 hypothetical protein C5C15_14310 [Rathayibacter rathayi]
MDESIALGAYPAPVPVPAARVAEAVARTNRVLIVLDDDPTGTQSVADLPVLTSWEPDDLRWALSQGARAVYVLTNTRSLDPDSAAERTRAVVGTASAVAADLGTPIAFVSRGDSTLRGHYPLETDIVEETLRDATGRGVDGVVLVPAFPDAGRITIGGVHLMRTPEGLVPVAETEFARDATFGYSCSDLAEWVAEKTRGRWAADQVVRLDLGVLRGGIDRIIAALLPLEEATPVIADAVLEDDLRLLALGLEAAEAAGKRLLYRVGPPFVRARIGQEARAPLTATDVFGTGGEDTGGESTGGEDTGGESTGGLVVVGSHVGLTSRQLAVLTGRGALERVLELDVEQVLAGDDAQLDSLVDAAVDALGRGDVALHTSRHLRRTEDADESLDISRRVSAAIVTVVERILARRRPRFVIAKGGITSSDVATHGLGIRRALVRGPMLPGIVSLWEPVDGPARGVPYIVFAGNVGDDDSLAAVVATLTRPSA